MATMRAPTNRRRARQGSPCFASRLQGNWTRNIQEKFDVKIPFPIIEDIKMDVAHAYGMVHPGGPPRSGAHAATEKEITMLQNVGSVFCPAYLPFGLSTCAARTSTTSCGGA